VPNPPLKPLHSESLLVAAKLDQFNRISTEILLQTLLPGQKDSLKVRPDGTILDGHHRIKVLRSRGVDVDALPRDVIMRE
jgi:hypothetical protein